MRKLKSLIVVGLVAGSVSLGPAAPARAASCDTELGDMCKFMEVVCNSYPKVTHLVLAYCRR